MPQKLALEIEYNEVIHSVAEIIDLSTARSAKQPKIDGEDYEAFLTHYGSGIASDFA